MKNFPERLKNARKMNGLSMQDLADRMGNQISKQAIGKYELGQMRPDSEILMALCRALHVRPDYFLREGEITLENVEFRKLTRLPAWEVEKIKGLTIDFLERYFEIEEILGIDHTFQNPIAHLPINGLEDIEKAAEMLREAWDIGSNHIPNVIELLEDQDIKVVELEANDSFSGLSTRVNGIPVIVLNSKMDAALDRKRFTALHELAHLLLNFPDSSSSEGKLSQKEIEKYCHAFAGAFLMPKDLFIEEFGGHRTQIFINELKLIKQNFGISMQAIMARAKNLHLISDQYYSSFFRNFSKLGYRKKEPGEYKGYEKSNRFLQLIYRAVAEEIISMSKAAALNNQKLADFRDLIAVTES